MKFWKKAILASAPLALTFGTPAAAQDAESEEDVMAMMAQMFPVEPLTPEEEARLPISQEIIDKMIPPGTLGEMMGSMFDGMMGPIMEMASKASSGDVAKSLGVSAYELDLNEKQLAEVATILDPVREERNAAIGAVMPAIMGRTMDAMEPSMRKAMTEAYAITFTDAELQDINAFFSTESGLSYARKSFTLASDPRVIGATMEAMPAMMEAMANMESEMEAATADLPPLRAYEELSPGELSRISELTGLGLEDIKTGMMAASEASE